MTIAQTRFWIDRDRGSIGIRSSNHSNYTQPFELYLMKWLRLLPDFKFYESTDDGGRELRLSFRFLWISLNMLICMLQPRQDGHRFDDRDQRWGWYFIDNCFVIAWGKWIKHIDMPFTSLQLVRHEILSLDRKRVVYTVPNRGAFKNGEYQKRQEAELQNSAKFAYRYECLNGDVQEVTATIHVERMVHRWTWTPFLRVTESIDVHFSEGVGPQRGSWKGGVTGCGYTLKRGETAIQCLRRMERERRFER